MVNSIVKTAPVSLPRGIFGSYYAFFKTKYSRELTLRRPSDSLMSTAVVCTVPLFYHALKHIKQSVVVNRLAQMCVHSRL